MLTTLPPSNQGIDCQVYSNSAIIKLAQGETFEVEPQAFIAGNQVSCTTRNASTGVAQAISLMLFSGESIFTNTFTGLTSDKSWIIIAPPDIGQIASYKFKDTSDKIYLVRGSYIASSSNVRLSTQFQSIIDLKGVGITTIEASVSTNQTAEARVFFHATKGSIIPINITPESPVVVDNNHIIAFTGKREELQCSYKLLSPSVTGLFCSGEGYVCEFSGQGTVFIRTHQPHICRK